MVKWEDRRHCRQIIPILNPNSLADLAVKIRVLMSKLGIIKLSS